MAAAWMDAVQERAFEVEVRCVRTHRVLANAAAYLAPPMLVAEAQDASSRILVALTIVADALVDLNRASNAITEATLLALHGAAADPMIPLPSIEHIPDAYHNARLALGLLQSARDCAVAACNSAGRCCRHLTTALTVLNAPAVPPGVDGFLEVERFFATVNFEAALASTVESAALAVVTNWLLG